MLSLAQIAVYFCESPLELIPFSTTHQTGPILFRVKFKKNPFAFVFLLQFPFQLNGERTNNVVHCRPFWLHTRTHALATRKYAELFKRVHILNGLSLDLLATLEEEKDSCVSASIWCSVGLAREQ